ncbi:uncharacterized protein PAC_08697 [Phialocephala subalpina]|uniref:Peptidase S54 rhomboid domain-containing protein n=1 Tax=Phialocephala subalpina TaxID=576137 RepID=A0A1L7X1B1_9HELO|nr:uncharacterized protein PAC_08697 [Phialocephala subalpina]
MPLFTRIVLPTARLNFTRPTSQRLCRPFTSTVLRLRKPPQDPQTFVRSRVESNGKVKSEVYVNGKRVSSQTQPQKQTPGRDVHKWDYEYKEKSQSQQQEPDRDEYKEEYEYEQEYEGNHRKIPWGARAGGTVTWGIIGTCGALFIYHGTLQTEAVRTKSTQAIQKLEDFRRNFVLSWEGIQNGRYYTLLTSTLMHNGIGHIAFNMLGLYSFAPSIIALFGLAPFTTLFVGSAITGGVVQYWLWNRNKEYRGAAVGASGALFGIITALTCVMPKHSIMLMFIPMPMWVAAGISVAASVAGLQGYWGQGIGHADHLGGMAFGVVFWALVLRRRPLGFMPYYP